MSDNKAVVYVTDEDALRVLKAECQRFIDFIDVCANTCEFDYTYTSNNGLLKHESIILSKLLAEYRRGQDSCSGGRPYTHVLLKHLPKTKKNK